MPSDLFKGIWVEPQLHFDYHSIIKFQKIFGTFHNMYQEMEEIRNSVKVAAGYLFDNSHFYVDNIYGNPVFTITFFRDFISIYHVDGDHIKDFYYFPINDEWKEITDNITAGLKLCNDCGEWVKKGHKYSFAGFVCNKCYDKTKHLPPDTRGD